MSQCVPNWDLDDGLPGRHSAATTTTATINIHAPMLDYVVSELTWDKGHPSRNGLHGSPPPRVGKLAKKRPSPGAPLWEKHLASGSLEAVVDQATRALVPAAVEALVPSAKLHDLERLQHGRILPNTGVRAAAGGTCGGRKRARPVAAGDGCSRSATGSAASAGLAFDSCEIYGDGGEETGFATSTSPLKGSPETENASCVRALTAVSDGDDSCYSRWLSQRYGSDEEEIESKNEKERSFVSTKRIRAAAVHNQSERKRRDRINQRMRTLQKLVPNSSKTDKASILDEVMDYMKQLQAQVQMMIRMNSIPPMMMPMAMQQMQMTMMAQMAQMAQLGMAMGMGMPDSGHPGMPWAPAFLPPSLHRDVPSRDPTHAPAGGAFIPDPFAAFMAFQAHQPMTNIDAHTAGWLPRVSNHGHRPNPPTRPRAAEGIFCDPSAQD